MAKKKSNVEKFGEDKIRPLYEFLSGRSGHEIVPLSILLDFLKERKIDYSEKKSKTGESVVVTITSSAKKMSLDVYAYSNESYKKDIKQEGRGGYMPDNDWLYFEPYSLLRQTVATLLNYHTSKVGRGSGYSDMLGELRKLVEELGSKQQK